MTAKKISIDQQFNEIKPSVQLLQSLRCLSQLQYQQVASSRDFLTKRIADRYYCRTQKIDGG
jgi:hypothetical protein